MKTPSFFDKLLNVIIGAVLDRFDADTFIDNFADALTRKFLKKLDLPSLEDKVQEKVLDPVKEWLEKKLGVNL